ncbi:MAG: integrase core domain-containing protein [Candidatus Hydrogenedentes bacterium]|nr:integrase core domain-containing protein [Candidatus Hydrogenedentota bacterium]
MNQTFLTFFALAMQWLRPRHNAHLQFMEAQIRILRARIDADRIVPTPEEKAQLLRLGALLDHDIGEIMHIVRPETYRRWRRQQQRGGEGFGFKKLGRPPTAQNIRSLVCRMARENLRWGYRRIVGELKKLGIKIGATTVRDICKESGIYPDPNKGKKEPPVPWTQFVHAHMESMIACDFFTKKVYTLRGSFDAYVLVFIHLGSRRTCYSAATYHPTGEWVMQQALNATMWMEDEGVTPRFLIHDRDRKFPDNFRDFWKGEGVRTIKIPPRAPRANAFCENHIGKCKRECLNHFICFSLSQLDYIISAWSQHFNTERPHRGIGMGNNVLDVDFKPQTEGKVCCKKRLGGIITTYYREAA